MSSVPPQPAGDEPVVWRVHPARERPWAAVLALSAVALTARLAYDLMGGMGWALLAVVVLLAALRRFFLPTEFRVDAEGVSMRFAGSQRRCRWQDIRRFVYDDRGGYVSTRRRASFLDAFRGLHLLFGRDMPPGQRSAVIARIRERMSRSKP